MAVVYARLRGDAYTAASGVDGLIVVDMPPEEAQELAPFCQKEGLDIIRLVAPTSDAKRLEVVLNASSGFVYYVAITGITGTRSADPAALERADRRPGRLGDRPAECRHHG